MMNIINKFKILLKKIFKNGKIKSLNIILLFSVLYFIIYIIISSAFFVHQTANYTYKKNLSNEEIQVTYYSGFSKITVSKYKNIIVEIGDLKDNLYEVFLYYGGIYFYDYNYIDIKLLDDKKLEENGVYLSKDYMDEYKIDDFYNMLDVNLKVLGFFEGENKIISNLDYALINDLCDESYMYYVFKYDDFNECSMNELIKTYNKVNNYLDETSSFSSRTIDTMIDIVKLVKKYSIISLTLAVCLIIYAVVAILNITSLNMKMDKYFYSMLRLLGVLKKELNLMQCFINIIFNVIALLLSLLLYYSIFKTLKIFLKKFILVIFNRYVDGFSYTIYMHYKINALIFILPFIVCVFMILIKTIIKSRSKEELLDIRECEENAR